MKTVVALHTSTALLERVKELWASYEVPGRLVNLIDDSLIWEVIENDGPTVEVRRRMLKMAQAAEDLNPDYIFSTCSSVGYVADIISELTNVPVIKIDRPMAQNAVAAVSAGSKIGVLATLPTTLPPTCSLVSEEILASGKTIELQQFVAEGAFQKLMAGDRSAHDEIVISKAKDIASEIDALVLAQGSMALLEARLIEQTGIPVFSSPELGVKQFKEILSK